jgi:hypothetical protein
VPFNLYHNISEIDVMYHSIDNIDYVNVVYVVYIVVYVVYIIYDHSDGIPNYFVRRARGIWPA